ncbi:MAG: HD domain-containing protein [Gammaproteobacteria bacterium]|nr:HD domain-containing protein [Gammaproteobacteria bacterium]
MFEHQDALEALNSSLPIKDKLVAAHEFVKSKFPFVARIAVAIYDPETRVLKTYLHSSGEDMPLSNYQTLLSNAPSLKEILKKGRPRVVNNLVTFENSTKEHAQRIGRQGYAASYTLPIFQEGEFLGFLFFNSYEANVFDEKVLSELDTFGHLISLMIINEISNIKVVNAAVRTSTQMAHLRDPETGSHLDRMSRYSRLIAQKLADKYQLNDDYIEHVFMFAPLHDIGKIAIPDEVLLKPGKLSDQEKQVIQQHARKGREMIDNMINNFKLSNLHNIQILQNIAEYHHEAVNGSGYPDGCRGDEIPLEARIVAVADVFDALTTRRCYKTAWSNAEAFKMLAELADETLDKDCVNALLESKPMVEDIQRRFSESAYG